MKNIMIEAMKRLIDRMKTDMMIKREKSLIRNYNLSKHVEKNGDSET